MKLSHRIALKGVFEELSGHLIGIDAIEFGDLFDGIDQSHREVFIGHLLAHCIPVRVCHDFTTSRVHPCHRSRMPRRITSM